MGGNEQTRRVLLGTRWYSTERDCLIVTEKKNENCFEVMFTGILKQLAFRFIPKRLKNGEPHYFFGAIYKTTVIHDIVSGFLCFSN